MKWTFFAGAVVITCMLLVTNGAPIAPVVLGVVLAGALTYALWNKQKKGRIS